MLISIIIPVYNVENYIENCLRSVMRQTMTQGIECIIINDCTIDNSMLIAEKLIEVYNGDISFRIIHHSMNSGLSAARNTGINAAQGKYLFFLDSDDCLTNDCLRKLYDIATLHPDAQIVQGSTKATNGDYPSLQLKGNSVKDYSADAAYVKNKMLLRQYPAPSWNKLISHSWLIKHNLYFREGLLHEDEYWQFFAAKYASAYAVCRDITYIYNIRPDSITTSPNVKNLQSHIISIEDFLNNIDNFCSRAQRIYIFNNAFFYYVHSTTDYYKNVFAAQMYRLGDKCNFAGKAIIVIALFSYHSVLLQRLLRSKLWSIIVRNFI